MTSPLDALLRLCLDQRHPDYPGQRLLDGSAWGYVLEHHPPTLERVAHVLLAALYHRPHQEPPTDVSLLSLDLVAWGGTAPFILTSSWHFIQDGSWASDEPVRVAVPGVSQAYNYLDLRLGVPPFRKAVVDVVRECFRYDPVGVPNDIWQLALVGPAHRGNP